jgi:hypothetical protein
MTAFPSSVYSPRGIANRPGVVFDAEDTISFFAEDWEAFADEIVAIETLLFQGGWWLLGSQPTLNEDQDPNFVLRFTADITATLSVGQKIKFTQNGATVYGIIMAVGAYSESYVDVVVYCGTDYNVGNTTTYPITNFSFSREKAPSGFPMSPLKWSVVYTNTTFYSQATPTVNQWYNLGSMSLVLPLGVWDISFTCCPAIGDNSTQSGQVFASLSTGSTSESDPDFTVVNYSSVAGGTNVYVFCTLTSRKFLALSLETTYYIVICTITSNVDSIQFRNSSTKLAVRAVCAYL